MPHTSELPNNIASRLAAQLSDFTASPRLSPFLNVELTLGESFKLWQLPATAVIEHGTIDPLDHSAPVGLWHHQIYRDNKAVGFARSIAEGPTAEDWRISALFESELASDIDQAISFVDERVPEDAEVRLLWIPAYQIHAFWIAAQDGNHVIPISRPAEYTDIERLTIYPSRKFFQLLSRSQHIIGIQP